MPPHLRVIQITPEPVILGPTETVFENVTFGYKKMPDNPEELKALENRSRRILERIGVSVHIWRDKFHERGFLGTNGVKISRTNQALIHIARGLVMNPEVPACRALTLPPSQLTYALLHNSRCSWSTSLLPS